MKKLFLLLTLFLLLPCVLAVSEDFNKAESLTIESEVSFPVKFESTGGSMVLDYIHVDFSWLPANDNRQTLLSLNSEPVSEKKDGSLFFDIKSLNDFTLKIDFKTKTSALPVKVDKKITFPIKDLDQDLIIYTKPTNLIDIDDNIKSLASSLASGEDDLYVVVFKLADWVNTHIEYNLSTATATATLKSSWVLEERQGVCDELSNLFVSMARSLGIPARVVSGITYTDSELFNYNWGAHGWTEVYFPGYGWIPFDPTYNQLGYVDATHITMNRYADEDRYNTKYEWRGKGFTINPGLQKIDSEVIIQGAQKSSDIDIDIDLLRDNVGFGSYNVISAKITNKRNYYVAKSLDISKTQGLNNIDETKKDILLKPKEVKRIYWVIKVDEDLRKSYIYTFPISIFSQSGEETEHFFKSQQNDEIISLRVANAYIDKEVKEIKLSNVFCDASKDVVYPDEKFDVICTFTDSAPAKLTLCIREECKEVSKNDAIITLSLDKPGFQTLVARANSKGFTDNAFFSINVVDSAVVNIENIQIPEKIGFDETADLKFNLVNAGSGLPTNLNIKIEHPAFNKQWKMDVLPEKQEFNLEFMGSDLKSKDNLIKITVDYNDGKGEKFSSSEEIYIELIDLTLFQKVQLFFNDVDIWLNEILG